MNIEILASVGFVIFGIILIVFRRKFAELQKKQAGSGESVFTREIHQKDLGSLQRTAIFVGTFFIALGMVTLVANLIK